MQMEMWLMKAAPVDFKPYKVLIITAVLPA